MSETHITVPGPVQSAAPRPFSGRIWTWHAHSTTHPQSAVYVGCLEYKFLERSDFHFVFFLWHSQYLQYCLAHSMLTITICERHAFLRELYLPSYNHLCPSDLPQAFIMWTRCISYIYIIYCISYIYIIYRISYIYIIVYRIYVTSLLGSLKVTSLRTSTSTTTSIHQKEYPNWTPRRETWDFLIVSSILDFRNRVKENVT